MPNRIEEPREEALIELAGLAGVHTSYRDMWGNLHHVSGSTLKAILSNMGYGDIDASLKAHKNHPWDRLMAPVLVVVDDEQPAFIPVRFPLEEGLESEVRLEVEFLEHDGQSEKRALEGITPSEEATIEGRRHVRVDIPNVTNRPMGYHRVEVLAKLPTGTINASLSLIITPARCHQPECTSWGITLSLYGLRSGKNAGVGDLGDLLELTRWAGSELKAGFIGINPLHSIPNSLSEGISPYSPISRLYRSLIYLDLGNIPLIEAVDIEEISQRLEKLRESVHVAYDEVAELKIEVLIKAFDRFTEKRTNNELPEGIEKKYLDYLETEGAELEKHATFMALAAHIRDTENMGRNWRHWPPEYQSPEGDAVAEFRGSHKMEIEFQKFLQWLLDEQLSLVSKAAGEMPIGLYLDLAVGSSDCGSDTWAHQDVFALGMNTGAPPDDFNPQGQNWIFPPLLPKRLWETGYEVFIKTIRANLKHAGALRIDHALGLFRIFFIPEGRPASEGTYVDYPADDLLKIIALESTLNRTTIIAEDLGTVTDEAREGLARRGMLSYRILYFERNWDSGEFLTPQMYPKEALAAVNTHDLPTLRGYITGRDIVHRLELGLIDLKTFETAIAQRERDVSALFNALGPYFPQGLDSLPGIDDLFIATHSYLFNTNSLLASVSLDDLMNSSEQQNIPGTVTGHPNWRRRSPLTLEELMKNSCQSNGLLFALVKIVQSRINGRKGA
jgi:4-alpha-glucanotransferase